MRVFTLDVGTRPTVVFTARNFAQADELRREQWLLDELVTLRTPVDNQKLWDRQAPLKVRIANDAEIKKFNEARDAAVKSGEHEAADAYFISYLVPVTKPAAEPTARMADPNEGRSHAK